MKHEKILLFILILLVAILAKIEIQLNNINKQFSQYNLTLNSVNDRLQTHTKSINGISERIKADANYVDDLSDEIAKLKGNTPKQFIRKKHL